MHPQVQLTPNQKTIPQNLKQRLDWGEPALTIIDARARSAFNISHIMGAISLPETELIPRAIKTLELTRDIYIYHSTDEKTSTIANLLRTAGFKNVFELTGGLAAWKAVGYPIEGNCAIVA
ncbi:MAG: rhodanese-like domain-containing protein [Gloeocapsa sp. DLM2.Bin57]|nr:MAG: rhodanese-like domain-containing protein [Gloeocapsa sp. DLM2.Bin57]